ncbi:MAG: acyl-CoA/acyl-ACP dehydrogenase [Desulfatitalea sp.]|nr:acyl-CoA/acyl-ACP dehydrogenase [Desulfatitalea sp.]NNK01439.1 acyl-CoA/acyl-ACP dehydrogenase [Desulfatitalea sp.]
MDFGLTIDQKSFINEIAEFCSAHCKAIDINDLEKRGADPEAIEQKLAAKSWYGLPFPEEYGGSGRGYLSVGLLIERLAMGGYPYPGRLQITMLNGLNVLKNGSHAQKMDLLPKICRGERTMSISVTEPNAGSNIASLQTAATPKDDGWVINGQKLYSSGAVGERNIIMVAARTDFSVKAHKGLTLFLVPSTRPGLKFTRLEAMGRNIGGLYEVFFDDVWVPNENVLGEVNKGWSAMTKGFNVERAIVSAGYLGFSERIFNHTVTIANERYGRNGDSGKRGAVMSRLAEFATELQAAKLLTYQALRLADREKLSIEAVCQCKVYGSELAKRLGDFCAEVAGGIGYRMDSLAQWYYRETRIVTVGGGSSQIMRNVAAAQLGLK